MKKYNLSSEIRGALRLIFRRSPHHKAALQKARVEKPRFNRDGSRHKIDSVYYRCSTCLKDFKVTEVEVDHITPIGSAPGSKNAPADLTWDIFIGKIFCDLENLLCVCKPCHKQKTQEDRNGLSSKIRRDQSKAS